MSEISDERLISYIDGELDAQGCAEVEAALNSDPQLGGRLAAHLELKQAAAGVFGGVLAEPVPERLTRAVAQGPVVRPEFSGGRSRLQVVAAMAACLVVGVFAGRLLAPAPSLTLDADGLAAGGALSKALEEELAAGDGPIRIGLTFRSQSGYCRTFAVPDAGLGGLACLDGRSWRVPVTAPLPAQQTGYRMASSGTPAAVLDAVDELIVGEPLDRNQEAVARRRGWR